MKKYKTFLLGICLILFSMSTTSISAAVYERALTVAEGTNVTKLSTSSQTVNKKAWKKINGICYNGSGVKIPDAITRGIDVSQWQEKIDWGKVKNSDVDFAFIRIAHGLNQIDTCYEYNMREAEKAGVPVGTYVFSTATTTKGALKEAQLAIRKMKGFKVSYPVVYDLEYSKIATLGKKKIAELALTFCNEIKKAGYYPMLYCNTHWYDNYVDLNKLKNLDVWIASYGDTIQAPSKTKYKYTIWQATDGDGGGKLNPTKGLIAGIPVWDNVDINFGYVDYTKKIIPRWNPVSNYTAATTPDLSELAPMEKIPNGWHTVGDKTYYYNNGTVVKGAKLIDGKYYCFDSKQGYLFKNVLLKSSDGTRVCYADQNGARVTKKWVECNGKKYYMGSDGYAYKGSRKIGKYYYQFAQKGCYMFKNLKVITSDKSIYYYDNNGRRCQSGFTTIKENGKNNTYYFGTDGKAYKGWKKINNKKYYFYRDNSKQAGVMAKNKTIISSTGYVSVFDKDGVCIEQYQQE